MQSSVIAERHGSEVTGCPVMDHDFSRARELGAYWALANELRESCPHFYNRYEGGGYWVFTRHEAVRDIYKTPQVFSSASITPWEPDPIYRFVPTQVDAPDHIKYRRILNPWFSPKAMEAAAPMMREICRSYIEPLVPKAASRYFGAFNYNVVTNPKVHVEIDDARHFILTTNEKFDAVTSDPLDTWVKGAATLYTQEFFEVVKKHLNPGGIMTLFVQLYESNTEGVKSEIATFFKAFPNGVVFANTVDGAGYDLVLVGQEGGAPMKIDIDAIQERLESPRYAEVAKSLREVGFENATQLFSTFAGNEPMLRPWLAGAQINQDRNLRLQFIAGLGLNLYDEAGIYSEMEKYRAFPDGLFTGKPGRLAQIRNALAP